MKDVLKVLRFHLVVLAIVTVGRWAMGFGGVPYETGHHVFSVFTVTILGAAFFAAFARKWRAYPIGRAVLLAYLMGLSTQVVIFLSTLIAYGLDLESYFNHPAALNVTAPIPFAEAMVRRAVGLLVGPILPTAAGALGWALGALLPPLSVAANTAAPAPPLTGPLPRISA